MTTTDKIKALPDGLPVWTNICDPKDGKWKTNVQAFDSTDLKALVSELETKTRALEAYASPDNWQNSTGPDERELRDQIIWRVPEDGFALAQAALKEKG